MPIESIAQYATSSFTMPDVCLRLRTMLDSGKHHLDDVGGLIAVDANLSAKVLRLANSALFRFPNQIDSLTKAISVVGGEALYNIVMAETASSAFQHFDNDLIDVQRHWHYSVYCGMAAKGFAKQLKKRAPERFFVMGILQGLSTLVIAQQQPEQFSAYKAQALSGLPWERQQSCFGFTFAQCSGLIMEQWRMPVSLYFPVQHMHQSHFVERDTDIAIMTLADQIALVQSDKAKYQSIALWQNSTQPALGLTDETIVSVSEHAESDTARVASILLH
ncbi:HDOD domain-containing protein [Alteromonas oceanisediminis]|uniref:HDOD domain-containing protein n=1 Tax=Alteromonas oceanisediminis TaxID=2836180 RepID=UPI001BD93042|nr:HDOD domain-containing protein [Alteromonas oceanisediminis]MBT0585554.1 HDOD domain-containing protein [Alteromonas oceanisediminis]